MKFILKFVILILLSTTIHAQEKEVIDLINSEEGWRAESFRFPMRFAPKVNFDGIADVRFTKGWQDKTSPEFWSYLFAWNISIDEKLSETEIENYMHLYFDGLMNVVKKDKTKVLPPTIAVFTSMDTNEGINYKGKIRFHDAFFTDDILTLNVKGTYSYCEKQKKTIYFFRLSPQELDHPVWEYIQKPSLKNNICDL